MGKRKTNASFCISHLEATSIYNSLSKVEFDSDDSGNPLTWADNLNIDSFMNQAIGKGELAYYIAPVCPGLNHDDYILNVLQHVCKRRTRDGSCINDHYDIELDKPFVSIVNIASVFANKPQNVNKEGGSHWVGWVLLPKKYTNVSGKVIENNKYRVYFFDSLAKHKLPKKLVQSMTGMIESEDFHELSHVYSEFERFVPLCSKDEIDFIDTHDITGQQRNSADCGWWACYYVLMTVYTGDVEFLKKLQGRGLSAKPLRSIMNLQESIMNEGERSKRRDSFYEGRLLTGSLSAGHDLLTYMVVFSSRFVVVFERHFLEFSKRLLEGRYKEGKYAVLFNRVIPAFSNPYDFLPYDKSYFTSLTCGLQWIATSISKFFQKKKVESLASKIHKFYVNQPDARIMFIKVAMHIFIAYEEQFAREKELSGKDRIYNSIYDLADDAVNRIIDYFASNTETEFNIEEMLKGVIHGNSKRYRSVVSGIPNFQRGHKTFVSTAKFISAPGIKHDKDYYQLELDSNVEELSSWGFRDLFPGEINRCVIRDGTLCFLELPHLVYREVEVDEKSRYKYCLTEEMCFNQIPRVHSSLENANWQITGELKFLAKEILEVCNREFSSDLDPVQHAGGEEDVNGHEETQIFPTNLFLLMKPTTSFFNKMSSTNIVSPEEKLHFFAKVLLSSFLFLVEKLVLPDQLVLFRSNTPHQCAQGLSASRIKEIKNFSRLMQSLPFGDLEKCLLRSGVRLFQGFERPFQSVTECQSNAKVIATLSSCAAFRMVDYISKNFNIQHLSCDLMVEAALLGGCDEGSSPLFCVKSGDSSVNTNEIYDKTPVFVSEGEIFSYSENFIIKHGTRLPFNFEKKGSQSSSQHRKIFMVDVNNFSQQQPHKYVLQNIDVVNKCNLIMEEMLRDERAQKSDILPVAQKCSEVLDATQNLHAKVDTLLAYARYAFPGVDGRGGPDDGRGGPGGGPGGPDDGRGGPGGGPGGPDDGRGGPGGDTESSGDSSISSLSEKIGNTFLTSHNNEESLCHLSIKRKSDSPEDCSNKRKKYVKETGERGSQPVWFGVRDPVSFFTGRERELEDLHSKMQSSSKRLSLVSRMLCLVGLGGIGKTQLARKYIKKYAKDYNENVIWINSVSKAKIVESFLELDRDHGLNFSTPATGEKVQPIEIIVKKVFSFFATNKSLFIFDNLDKIEDISCFLPLNIQYSGNSWPHILITSRNRDWAGEMERLELGLMSYQDAVIFVKNGLDIEDESQEKIGILLEKLQYFPLAIQQAISYIRDRRLVDKFGIDDYLNLYVIDKKKLLSYTLLSDINNEYFHTTLVTWKITVDKIKGNQEYGRLALDILHVISYLGSDDIPVELFLSLVEKDNSELKFSIRMLVASSIVDITKEKSSVSVHRLVQETTRLILEELGKSKEVMKKTFGLLMDFLFDSTGIGEVYGREKQFLKHSEELFFHMGDWLVKESGDKKTLREDYLSLLKLIPNSHPDCCSFARQKQLYEKALPILTQLYGPESLEVAEVQEVLARIYEVFGEYEKQKKYLQKCLFVFTMFYGSDTSKVAEVMKKLAIACEDLGHHKEQEAYIKKVLPTLIRIYGPEHIEVAEMRESLAAAYECLGNHREQKECLECLLPVFEKVPGYSDKVTEALEKLAQVSVFLDDMQGEQKYLECLLHHVMKVGHDKVPKLAKIVVKLAVSHRDLGNYDRCIYYLEDLLRYFITFFSYDSHEVANLLIEIGKARYLVRDDEGSQKYFLNAFFIFEKIACPDNLGNFVLARAMVEFSESAKNSVSSEDIIEAFSNEVIKPSGVRKSCSNPKERFDRIVDMLSNGKLDLLVDILSSCSYDPSSVFDEASVTHFEKTYSPGV
ncbi:tetratricopeptide repeat protein [Wolbachia endosymbiont (group A) of Ancistrocerus nigricornis]|uniref:tetratricopeptide repeat protein n=1 Tax=Wolbachia endosymbiont (group A) of Ancistrocerus nigricornis TaxID=2953974 RepID=UPI0022262172|nr:tetratricopeptide repeat protein [Wolbachia endosymbiont (group A) of Ancistrocerus nigricornis]